MPLLDSVEEGRGLSVVCPGLCPCRVLLFEVGPYVRWDTRRAWVTEGQVLSLAELGEELSAVFSSNRQYPFRLLCTKLQVARPEKQGIWRRSGKGEVLEEASVCFVILVS